MHRLLRDFAYYGRVAKELIFPRRCAVCATNIDNGYVCEQCRKEYLLHKVKLLQPAHFGRGQRKLRFLTQQRQPACLTVKFYFMQRILKHALIFIKQQHAVQHIRRQRCCLTCQVFLTRTAGQLYTAVTRAKEKVLIVGSKNAVRTAVENDKTKRRYSLLAERLQESSEVF